MQGEATAEKRVRYTARTSDVAEEYGVDKVTVRRWIAQKLLDVRVVGGRWMIAENFREQIAERSQRINAEKFQDARSKALTRSRLYHQSVAKLSAAG